MIILRYSIVSYDVTSIYHSISHENYIEQQDRDKRNTSFSATNFTQWEHSFPNPPFTFWVRVASLNSRLSLGGLGKRGPLEHVRDHIQRAGSRDSSFYREYGIGQSLVKWEIGGKLSTGLGLRRRAEDWVVRMARNRGYLNDHCVPSAVGRMLHD